MPAGVGWGQYVRFSIAAYLAMMAGAQVVHVYYHPLDDLKELIGKHKERLLLEHQSRVKGQEVSPGNSNDHVTVSVK